MLYGLGFDKTFIYDYTDAMKRFFDFPLSVWSYFQDVDKRFCISSDPPIKPVQIESYHTEFNNIRVVLWDIYGTLFFLSLGDLDL